MYLTFLFRPNKHEHVGCCHGVIETMLKVALNTTQSAN